MLRGDSAPARPTCVRHVLRLTRRRARAVYALETITERPSMNLHTVEALIREIEIADPIDWGMLNISEEEATRLIALSVVQHYEEHISPMTESDREYVFVSAIAKLTLENFVLNVKLAQALGRQG